MAEESLLADTRFSILIRRLCATPFASVEDLSGMYRLDVTDTHRKANRVARAGLIRPVTHTLDSRRSSQRWAPTRRAVRGLAAWDGIMSSEMLRTTHVSQQWQRELIGRLDIVACIYRLIAAMCDVEESEPMDVRLYRSGALDAAVRLPGERWLGIMVKRSAFGGRYFTDRMKFARPSALRLSGLFIVVPDPAASLTILRAARQYLRRVPCVVGLTGQARETKAEVWTIPRLPETAVSLAGVMERFSSQARSPRRRTYSLESEPRDDASSSPHLSLEDKRLIQTICDWPLAGLAGLARIAGRGPRGARKTIERLRARGLIVAVRLQGMACYALSNSCIGLVSAASRTREDDNLRSWSADRTDDDLLRGTKLRKLAREIVHTHMTHQFIGDFRTQVDNDGGNCVRMDSIMPPHDSERYFRMRGTRGRPHSLRPDACILINMNGVDHALLVEIERTAVRPATMRRRLVPHRRYFDSGRAEMDFGLVPKILVVMENERIETRFLASQEMHGLDDLPLFMSNLEAIGGKGPLGDAWLRPGHRGGKRVPFWLHP